MYWLHFCYSFPNYFHECMLIGLLYEMLRSAKSVDSKAWKVWLNIDIFTFLLSFYIFMQSLLHLRWQLMLAIFFWFSQVLIMDKVTVKVMSHSCKMADITDQEVSRKSLRYGFSEFISFSAFLLWEPICSDW